MYRLIKYLIPLALFYAMFAVLAPDHLQAQRRGMPARGRMGEVESAVDTVRTRLDSLIEALRARVDTLEQKEQERELKELLEAADRFVQKEKEEEFSLGRKFRSGDRQLQALNPNISVNGDMYGSLNTSNDLTITGPGEFTEGGDRFFLRMIDIDFVAPLDPFTRGKFFFGVDGNGHFSVGEAYMEWLNLFGTLNLKIGKFNAQFAELNRWHSHALPQFDRPRPLVNLFSKEELNGFGLSGNFLLPSLFAHENELDIEVINGGNGVSFTSDGVRDLIYVTRLKNYYDLNRNTYLEIGVSGATGKNGEAGERRTVLGAIDLTLKWAPVDRQLYRTVEFRNEFYYSSREQPQGKMQSIGFFSSLRGKLNSRFWIGERLDYSELPWDKARKEWSFSPHLDFWQSEWVMLRLQYTYTRRNYMDDDNAFILQFSWAMGPHKHEAY